ncbi:MAG TPA: glycerophosphodiester phosphodiesterase [Ilumatobacter sp.]|nr:glycerophosphodiester phosphodiesterase [Ilumatobacter sp.]
MRLVTLVLAHRGASAQAPENTLAAFELAVALGAEGIELDVRRSGDDRLVVHHDAHLPDGRAIRATAAAELPEHVPSLDAALDACAGAFVNIEIKNDPNDPDHDPSDWVAWRVAERLARRGEDSRWLISSFRLATVDRVRRIAPSLRTAWLTYGLDDGIVATTVAHGHAIVHPWVGQLPYDALRAAHAAGLAVNTWTCDDPDRMQELIAWGIDGICTNVPDVALAVRRGTPT